MSRVLLGVLLTGLLGGCAAALAHATPADAEWAAARWPGTTQESLEVGRHLYAARCSGCHALHLPQQVPPQRWPAVLDAMMYEVQLTTSERAQIERFVVTVASRLPQPPRGAPDPVVSAATPRLSGP